MAVQQRPLPQRAAKSNGTKLTLFKSPMVQQRPLPQRAGKSNGTKPILFKALMGGMGLTALAFFVLFQTKYDLAVDESRIIEDMLLSDTDLDRRYDVCIVGAGLSGSVLAERYASELKSTVLVLEKRHHIGGNCYDFIDPETGIRISKYGAHLFHTKYPHVESYVKNFGKWVPYEHKVRGIVNGHHVPIPVNIETVNTLFGLNIQNPKEMNEWLLQEQVQYDHAPVNSEEIALSRVGHRLYDLIFRPYTYKQWAKYPAELGPEVLSRIPVRNNTDERYFSDPFQALPQAGYTSIFEQMLSSPLITVRTKVDYFDVKDQLKCGKLYFSGPIDAYFADTGWPKLEYRSLDFERKVEKNSGTFQPHFVVNHPQNNTDFTRIVEYKHLFNQKSDYTVYFIERSKDGGEPYYPVPNEKNKALFQKYKGMASRAPDVTFVGRLANYKYFNMDGTSFGGWPV